MSMTTLKAIKGAQRKIVEKDRYVFNIISYILIALMGLACMLPFLLVFITSLTTESALMHHGYSFFIAEFSTQAYDLAFRNPDKILWAYRNTTCATLIGTTLSVLLSTMRMEHDHCEELYERNSL